jgi:predicted enzyme related to lactoylglutathione lyase
MKRFHVHVRVADLDRSMAFYAGLFGAAPTVIRDDYAKWMLDDPRINFAISGGNGATGGIEHLGIESEGGEELAEVYGRLRSASGPVLEEGMTACCYARSEKSWIGDPDGVIWKAFHTVGENTTYGDAADFSRLAPEAAAAPACCIPQPLAPAASGCC